MTVVELITRLLELQERHGDLEVMLPENDGERVFEASTVKLRTAKHGEFHHSWNMPEGFQFIEILTP